MVILSGALMPAEGVDDVGRTFSLGCSHGGFFLERHPKLAPVDSMSDGIFVAGACQGPKDIPDSVAQGAAAAAGALSLIDKGKVVIQPITAEIDEDKCGGCQLCVANCPYAAIDYDEEKKISVVTEELCKGCGTCVASCPSSAAHQKNFDDDQILSEIEGVLVDL
jgi:heterodisulfide reductase subunit A